MYMGNPLSVTAVTAVTSDFGVLGKQSNSATGRDDNKPLQTNGFARERQLFAQR